MRGMKQKGAVLRVLCVCQLVHSSILWSGGERCREGRCDTCRALFENLESLAEFVSLKCFRILLIVSDVVPKNK